MNTSSINWNNKRLIIALHLSFWIVGFAIFLTITGSFYNTTTSGLRTASNLIFLALLFYGNSLFFVNRYLEQKEYFKYVSLVTLFFFTINHIRVWCNSFFPENFYEPFIASDWRSYIFTMVTSLGALTFSLLYQVLLNRAKAERKTMETIHELNVAKLQFLKAQINPHFLFNTLNNIYSLSLSKSEETPEMILKLSDLLRYVIYKGQESHVKLESEVEHIEKFIELFQMRSEEDLDIRFVIEGNTNNLLIEPMILIPLVENCFKHCDFDSNKEAFIQVELIIESKKIVFKTSNSKNDSNQQKDKTGGVGLINIQKRLELNYKKKHQLKLTNNLQTFDVYLELDL